MGQKMSRRVYGLFRRSHRETFPSYFFFREVLAYYTLIPGSSQYVRVCVPLIQNGKKEII